MQALVSGALLHGESTYRVASLLREGCGVAATRRLHVYRNNLFASLGAALGAVYPVVARLVGAAFFRQLAHGYVLRHPSLSGNLHDFGARLPDYLRKQSSLAALPTAISIMMETWISLLRPITAPPIFFEMTEPIANTGFP